MLVTAPRAIARPRPEPRLPFVEKKGSKTRSRTLAATPGPLSRTETRASVSVA